ncbi:flagellar protein FlaG [Methylobacterium sp. J-070]|uniref:flagellar protein FlaG n=1 Tax=Methylobacterium sp. J-070 TaxID=2836650 RepID=UPI001FBB5F6F|nr:flagellar protein FlaG [Methylobacterium sp. J-070]MCJ2053575.1 flagellar protein FlaG [Methylobacterium sp. J-070]
MEIRPLTNTTPGPQGLDALGATAASAATQAPPETPAAAPTLEPAVKLDIGTNGNKARYIQDPDTSSIVFQVVDPNSGNVIEQLPSETALRNRAYDSTHAPRGSQAGGLSRVA